MTTGDIRQVKPSVVEIAACSHLGSPGSDCGEVSVEIAGPTAAQIRTIIFCRL